jgi:hypothetical protein
LCHCGEALLSVWFCSDLQGIIAEINEAIGATGVISGECKMIVAEYGDLIIEALEHQVRYLCTSLGFCYITLHSGLIEGLGSVLRPPYRSALVVKDGDEFRHIVLTDRYRKNLCSGV